MTEQSTQSDELWGAPLGFLFMAFTDEKSAGEALKAMEQAKKRQRFYFENAAVIRQDSKGKVHFRETSDMHGGQGATIGAFVGGALGLIGGPAGMGLGAAAGAAIGAFATTRTDEGFDDKNIKNAGKALKNGTSAIAAVTSLPYLHNFREQYDTETIQRLLNDLQTIIAKRLEEGKNVTLGVIKTDSGLMIKEASVGATLSEMINKWIMHDE
jgi:uncharacterized membrane protein